MIIPNGTLQFITSHAGGLDENGYPVQSTEVCVRSVPCQYSANTYDKLGKSNGETFTRATYSILIENYDMHRLSERVRLIDRHGKQLGEYPVLEFEPLDAVCQIRIIV